MVPEEKLFRFGVVESQPHIGQIIAALNEAHELGKPAIRDAALAKAEEYRADRVFAEHWLEHTAERGFPAYAMSLRGHGGSGDAPKATLRAYVHDVTQVAAGLPRQAVLVGQSGSYVFVVGDSGVARVQPVTTGRTVRDLVVVEQGLEAGVKVVTDGQSRLEPGAKVEVRPPVGGPQAGRSSP